MRARYFAFLPLALAYLLASCYVPSGLLSDEERNSLYSLDVSSGGKSLQTGGVLSAGSSLSISIAAMTGAKNPDTVVFDLVDSSGAKAASLAFSSSPSSRGVGSGSAQAVSSVIGKLPAFSIPNGLAPGYYVLRASIQSADSEVQKSSFAFFVPSNDWELGGVAFSPSVPRAGEGILLTASIVALEGGAPVAPSIAQSGAAVAGSTAINSPSAASAGSGSAISGANPSSGLGSGDSALPAGGADGSTGSTAAITPSTPAVTTSTSPGGIAAPSSHDRLWLRWSQGNRVFAEGPVAKGYDRVVWQLPPTDGPYSVRVDFYPGPPSGDGYTVNSPWSQTLSFIAKAAAPDKFRDPLSRPARFFSLFTFDGTIVDSGSRPIGASPALVGAPSLAAFPGGYGERFDAAAGFSVSDLGFDPSTHGGKFSIVTRFNLEGLSGDLVSLPLDGGGRLAIGVDQGSLWLEYPGMGDAARVVPGIVLSKGFHDLMLSFSSVKSGVSVVWSLDGGTRTRVTVPEFSARFDDLAVGGPSSAAAIWDGLGLSYDDGEGPPRLFAWDRYRLDGSRVLLASGFEGGIGSGLSSSGALNLRPLSVALEAGASLSSSADFATSSGIAISIGLRSGAFVLELRDPSNALVASISSDGRVADSSGNQLASVAQNRSGFSISITKDDKGLEARGSDGVSVRIAPTSPVRLRPVIVCNASAVIDSLEIALPSDGRAQEGI